MTNIAFKGKGVIQNHHLGAPQHALALDAKRSLWRDKRNPPTLRDNAIIHGDNLLALKALLPTHAGKIKCVYIDPPYNTGNENWVYNDNVNNPMIKQWLGETVNADDLTKHDKWLCMMYPRLQLLYELLAPDGVIFISIDDNEVHHLRMLMDEIFGSENFLNQFAWVNNLKGRQIAKLGAARTHEYIVAYAKSIEGTAAWSSISIKKATRLMPDTYKMGEYAVLQDKIGAYVIKNELHNTNSAFNEKTRPNLVFKIHYCPATNKVLFTDVDSAK